MSKDYDNREITEDEDKWSKKLLKVLNAMPRTIEICVSYSGSVYIRNRGADARYHEKHGDCDNVPDIKVLMPKTCRQIDGRDSML